MFFSRMENFLEKIFESHSRGDNTYVIHYNKRRGKAKSQGRPYDLS